MTKTLVDTNILVYSVQADEGGKHDAASKAISELMDRGEMAVSVQNLVEFSRILLEKASPNVDHETVKQYVFGFMKFSAVISYSSQSVSSAISLSRQHKIHFFDALLAATMEENRITKILTEDVQDFSKVPWLEVKSPFKQKG